MKLNSNLIKRIFEYHRTNKRKGLKVGDLVRIKEQHMPDHMYFYYKVNRFYPLQDGGEGVEFKGLTGGTITASMPMEQVLDVTHFKSLAAMQEDINEREKTMKP